MMILSPLDNTLQDSSLRKQTVIKFENEEDTLRMDLIKPLL